MPGTPNTSFIPKQGPIRRPRQTATRHIHVLSIISYVVLASTILASGGVFLYQRHVESQMEMQIQNLDQAIASFSEADMEQVREFNVRLAQTRDRLDNGVSVAAIFTALEQATVESVSLESLKLERFEDDKIELSAKVMTDSFDSSLFQRGVFERSEVVDSVEIEDLTLIQEVSTDDATISSGVSFMAKIGVPVSSVPNTGENDVLVPINDDSVVNENMSTATTTEETITGPTNNTPL